MMSVGRLARRGNQSWALTSLNLAGVIAEHGLGVVRDHAGKEVRTDGPAPSDGISESEA